MKITRHIKSILDKTQNVLFLVTSKEEVQSTRRKLRGHPAEVRLFSKRHPDRIRGGKFSYVFCNHEIAEKFDWYKWIVPFVLPLSTKPSKRVHFELH
jgi:phage terminase large subunit-like protein